MKNVYDELRKTCDYAYNKGDQKLIWECFGMIKMAHHLKAITDEQYADMTVDLLVSKVG